jgi:hypothetical protein
MDNNENSVKQFSTDSEFTFKRLFALIKKSGFRILIFVAATVFITGVVGGSVYLGTKDLGTYSALVDFNYPGIEEGKDPFGRNLDVTKIKSPEVVSSAIAALKAKGINISTEKQDDIINNINIEGVVPEDILQKILVIQEIATKSPTVLQELTDLKYFSSRYKISIGKLDKIGLKKTDAGYLVNQIIEEYISYFKKTYSSKTILAGNVVKIVSENGSTAGTEYTYDFIELYDIYYAQIVSALSYLNAINLEAPSFRSNETLKTFSDLIYDFTIIRDTDLVKYETFVVQNGISNDIPFVLSYLNRQLETLNTQKNRAASDAEALQQVITSYDNGDIIYIANGDSLQAKGGPTAQYDRLFADLSKFRQEENRIEAEITNLQQRISKYEAAIASGPSSEELQANMEIATARSQIIANRLLAAINTANRSIAEYYDTEYFDNAVSIAVPAAFEQNQSDFLMWFALALVSFAVIAAVAAVTVTYYRLKKKNIAV